MDRRHFMKTMGAGLAMSTIPAIAKAASTPPINRPNIIFIMADDLGYGDLGCYGQKMIQTPNIDKLAQQGTRFTQAYAGSTVCAPSRCSLMTGKHNGHNRVRDNLPHGVFLQPDDFTIAELMKQAGYRTGGIGKWSLGNPGSWGVANMQGFDDFLGHLNQDQAHFYYPDYLWENDQVRLLFGNRAEAKKEYTHDLFTEHALSFIDIHQQHPFYLYLAYTIPHYSDYPDDTPEHYIVPDDAPYTNKDWPQIEKNYAAMISRMDKDVGKIMEQIKSLGLEENTLIIFTSDNGPYNGSSLHDAEFFSSNGPLKGYKRDMYEGGIRIPFIARWKNKVPAGKTSDQVFAFWDMLPTFAEVVGIDPPQNMDGFSVLPALLGKEQKQQHKYLYWDYGHVRDNFMQAVRSGKWKGIRQSAHAPLELYDLDKDLGEENNIASQHPDVVKQLEGYMKEALVPSKDYPIKTL